MPVRADQPAGGSLQRYRSINGSRTQLPPTASNRSLGMSPAPVELQRELAVDRAVQRAQPDVGIENRGRRDFDSPVDGSEAHVTGAGASHGCGDGAVYGRSGYSSAARIDVHITVYRVSIHITRDLRHANGTVDGVCTNGGADALHGHVTIDRVARRAHASGHLHGKFRRDVAPAIAVVVVVVVPVTAHAVDVTRRVVVPHGADREVVALAHYRIVNCARIAAGMHMLDRLHVHVSVGACGEAQSSVDVEQLERSTARQRAVPLPRRPVASKVLLRHERHGAEGDSARGRHDVSRSPDHWFPCEMCTLPLNVSTRTRPPPRLIMKSKLVLLSSGSPFFRRTAPGKSFDTDPLNVSTLTVAWVLLASFRFASPECVSNSYLPELVTDPTNSMSPLTVVTWTRSPRTPATVMPPLTVSAVADPPTPESETRPLTFSTCASLATFATVMRPDTPSTLREEPRSRRSTEPLTLLTSTAPRRPAALMLPDTADSDALEPAGTVTS